MVARQKRPPNAILVAPGSAADVDNIDLAAFGAKTVSSERGSCAQRNAILNAAEGADVLVFFDDDFFPCNDYLTSVEQAFREETDLAMTTGSVIADGIKGPGLSVEEARQLVENAERMAPKHGSRPKYNGYGCNMAYRLEIGRRERLVFDEALPMYGWLEDIDFSRRLARYGRIVKLYGARGVHLGVKSGRSPGVQLGYSQIANPLYLMQKGTLSPHRAGSKIARNLVMNLVRSLSPETYIDRRGRLRGNAMALRDAMVGESNPRNISKIRLLRDR